MARPVPCAVTMGTKGFLRRRALRVPCGTLQEAALQVCLGTHVCTGVGPGIGPPPHGCDLLGAPRQKPTFFGIAQCPGFNGVPVVAPFPLPNSLKHTRILGIQKHFVCPRVSRGMGVRGGTLELKQYLWHCAVQTPLSQVSKNTFAGLRGTVVWVF